MAQSIENRPNARQLRLFPMPPPVWLSLLPDAARELRMTGDIIMPQGDRRRSHRSEAAEVERVLAIFVPAECPLRRPSHRRGSYERCAVVGFRREASRCPVCRGR